MVKITGGGAEMAAVPGPAARSHRCPLTCPGGVSGGGQSHKKNFQMSMSPTHTRARAHNVCVEIRFIQFGTQKTQNNTSIVKKTKSNKSKHSAGRAKQHTQKKHSIVDTLCWHAKELQNPRAP